MEKNSLEPSLHIRFTHDFSVVQVDGEVEDPSSFGVTMLSAMRALEKGANGLSIGKPRAVRGRSANEGFMLALDDSGHSLKGFSGVTQWSDIDSALTPTQDPVYPVLPEAADIPGWVDQIPAVRWRGLRTQSDDQWSHCFHDPELAEDTVAAFGLAALQFDLLIRSLGLPRRELQFIFAEHIMRMAVNNDSDFLLAIAGADLAPSESSTLDRCMSFFAWPI